MELGLRCFFRLGVCLLLLFVAFRNFCGFPQETEAIAIRFGYRNRGRGGYNSNYGGRVIYTNFGRSRSNFGNLEPVDKDRQYYETKMAEWREQNKHLLTKNDGSEDGQNVNDDLNDFDHEEDDNNSESQEYDYDYQETQSTTTTVEPSTAQTISENTTDGTTTTISTAQVKSNSGAKKSFAFGLRYGRVKMETLKQGQQI